MKKIFKNPETGKEWWIEVCGQEIRTCLNNGKIKEMLCDSDYDRRNKVSKAMMEKMRKGFVYQNPEAGFGQVGCYQFVGNRHNGFMPIAALAEQDDFFITRMSGDFEDEILYHFDAEGNVLETVSLGAKRMTYHQVLCCNDTILMNNSYLIEQFSINDHTLVPFANQKDSQQTMLDGKGTLVLWNTGEEIIVHDFSTDQTIWSEKVKCQKAKEVFSTYYCEGLLSPGQTMMCYRTEEQGYVLVDLKTSEKHFIENRGWHPFFSPDDRYISVGGKCYACESGKETGNPFPFEINQRVNVYGTCQVRTRGDLIAIQQSEVGRGTIEVWDYRKREMLTTIDDPLVVKNVRFEFTKNNLILHTDYGAVCLYNCVNRVD